MYRTRLISKRATAISRQGAIRVTKRRIATESAAPSLPKKKRGIIRKTFWTALGITGAFYVGSTFAAFYNQTYYDFFSDHVPLGQSMLEFAEARNWDTLTLEQVVESGKQAITTTQHFVTERISGTKRPQESPEPVRPPVERKMKESGAATVKDVHRSTTKVEPVAEPSKRESAKAAAAIANKNAVVPKHEAKQDDLAELIQKAEDALKSPAPLVTSTPETTSLPKELPRKDEVKHVYGAPLPVGFEPPPGFSRPSPPRSVASKPTDSAPAAFAPIMPSVSSLGTPEPIIVHLAGTIDDLASYVASNPSAASKISDVLETAKTDLGALANRIEKAKEEERVALESKLDEQTREYTLKLMELEMEAQDKLDNQEEDFRKFFDEERMKISQAYRAKLEHELRTQTELINERLKEEVIAQGIELQRRWIRDIKVRVEQERGGRLGKIDELASHLKRLERIALDNSSYLDENIRVHALWSAFRALASSALTSPIRKPFREELRVLRHIAAAREDPVVTAALESLESSQVPDVGVEPFADLTSWFASDVAPKVCNVALVPEENAGVLSYLASHLFSGLQFRKQGLVNGDDVLSVIARAEYYLNERDLDSAARELNQLKGAAKTLLHDWLEAARRRLEVEQALQVVQTQATLASLLVV